MTWRPLIPGLLLAVLLSGCGDSNPADRSEGARPGPSQSPPTRLAASTTQTSTPIPATTGQPPGRVVAVGPDLAVTVPPGWRVLRTAYPSPGVEPSSLCLVPPGRHLRSCAGVSFAWGPDLPGPRGSGTYRPDQPRGWDDGTELALCPVGASTDNLIEPGLDRPTGSGPREVGNRRAAWNQWHASCSDGSTFDPQAWFLPRFDVLVKDLTGHRRTTRVLASVRFRHDGAAIPPGATYHRAWLTAVDGDSFTITPSRAAAVPRDVDVSHAVCNLMVPGEIIQPVIGCGRFARDLRTGEAAIPVGLWLDADGTVAQVSEILRS